jgi:hypothetical protein
VGVHNQSESPHSLCRSFKHCCLDQDRHPEHHSLASSAPARTSLITDSISIPTSLYFGSSCKATHFCSFVWTADERRTQKDLVVFVHLGEQLAQCVQVTGFAPRTPRLRVPRGRGYPLAVIETGRGACLAPWPVFPASGRPERCKNGRRILYDECTHEPFPCNN